MIDREKVIQHFEDALGAYGNDRMWRFVRVDILEDAITLLKEQEPRVMTFEETNRRANKEAQEITEYISKKEAVSRISDLLINQLEGKRLPTWNEVYHAIND